MFDLTSCKSCFILIFVRKRWRTKKKVRHINRFMVWRPDDLDRNQSIRAVDIWIKARKNRYFYNQIV